MTRPDLLTTAEVGDLAGVSRNYAPTWCARRGILRVYGSKKRPFLYQGAAVRAAAEAERESEIPESLRLRRWVTKALIA